LLQLIQVNACDVGTMKAVESEEYDRNEKSIGFEHFDNDSDNQDALIYHL
jgi:hypothetical protein